MATNKPVLGLYDNELEFRDALCVHLERIEPGLTLIKKNYQVRNTHGADGHFDILAKDRYNNFVIIEVKRSNSAARQALHELSKYISLFLLDQKVDLHKIRCFLVSTHWHELDIALSYFRQSNPVDVKGFLVEPNQNDWAISTRELPPVDILPKLCPDARFVFGDKNQDIRNAISGISEILRSIQGVRLAIVLTDKLEESSRKYKAVLCTWRIPDEHLSEVSDLVGSKEDEEGYYEGWGAETSLLEWVIDQTDLSVSFFREFSIATPEKISRLFDIVSPLELLKFGDWPDDDLVNDLAEVTRCLTATDVSPTTHRSNRYSFDTTSSKKTGKSWKYVCKAFTDFIGYVPHWQSEAEQFLASVEDHEDVIFKAEDYRHFFYSIYQWHHYGHAHLTQFLIIVKDTDKETRRLFGGWEWDGVTCPGDPVTEVEAVYGSLSWCKVSLFSAVDEARYENAQLRHGFLPYVVEYDYRENPPSGNVYLIAGHTGNFGLEKTWICL